MQVVQDKLFFSRNTEEAIDKWLAAQGFDTAKPLERVPGPGPREVTIIGSGVFDVVVEKPEPKPSFRSGSRPRKRKK